jgi:hypothetical protein
MLASTLLTAALWPVAVTQYCNPSDKTLMVGVAKVADGTFIYCEQVTQPSQTELRVDYVKDKKNFASKDINYSINTTTPAVLQNDFRFGEVRQASVTEEKIVLYYQANNNKKTASTDLAPKEVDVIDAGFDNFVRIHWDELQSGKTLSINFASMSHLKSLPLRVSSQPLGKCDKETSEIKLSYCFYVEIDNAFLRMLLGNIKLTYDQLRRLEEFEGVVNILSENESNQTAKIHYYYLQDYLTKKIP